MTGIIDHIDSTKTFGFILGEDRIRYFFHRLSLKNAKMEELDRGMDVTFEEVEGRNGPRAEDVYI